jgi:hypothetical protein
LNLLSVDLKIEVAVEEAGMEDDSTGEGGPEEAGEGGGSIGVEAGAEETGAKEVDADGVGLTVFRFRVSRLLRILMLVSTIDNSNSSLLLKVGQNNSPPVLCIPILSADILFLQI